MCVRELKHLARRYNIREFRIRGKNPDVLMGGKEVSDRDPFS